MDAPSAQYHSVWITIIGSLNIDIITRSSSRLPIAGESLLAESLAFGMGGKGANQAVAVARIAGVSSFEDKLNEPSHTNGLQSFFSLPKLSHASPTISRAVSPLSGKIAVRMLGAVGCDNHGDHIISCLRAECIDVTHVNQIPNKPTGVANVLVDKWGENMIMILPGANMSFQGIHLPSLAQSESCDYFVAQLEISLSTVCKIFELIRVQNPKAICALNPSPAPQYSSDSDQSARDNFQLFRKLCSFVDVMVINANELFTIISGHAAYNDESINMCETLSDSLLNTNPLDNDQELWNTVLSKYFGNWGIRLVIITLGGRGVVYWGIFSSIPLVGYIAAVNVPSTSIVDTTGAGDTFMGAFVVALSARSESFTDLQNVVRAIHFAQAAAALSIQRPGAMASIPHYSDLKEPWDQLMHS